MLYLIPTPLGENEFNALFPAINEEIINTIDDFIVEDLRTGRRFLKKAGMRKPIDTLNFMLLNEHTREVDAKQYLQPCLEGKHVGLMSDAGTPCVADPGNVIVAAAHRMNIPVVPLVGPNSIIMSLMASGLNGQNFTFNGYLPVERDRRENALRTLEGLVYKHNQTQIFIETPYRNNHMIESVLQVCNHATILCVAADVATPQQTIISKTVGQWKKSQYDFHKRPAVFLLGK